MRRIFLLLVIFSPVYVFAQAMLSGKVLDESSNRPVAFATVMAGDAGTITDEQGIFRLEIPAGDTVEVTVSFVGFEPVSQKVYARNGQEIHLEIRMHPANQLLETAVVTAGRFEKPVSRTTVSLAVIKPKLLEATNTVTLDAALTRTSGVDVIDGQANIRGGAGYAYGAGSRVLLLLDGMPIMQSDAAFPNWKDMPIENVGQIEILKGASSALYGSSAMNGVVNLRTAVPEEKPYLHAAPFYQVYFAPKEKEWKWWAQSPFTTGGSLVYRQRIRKTGITLGGMYLREMSVMKGLYTRYGRIFAGIDQKLSERWDAGIKAYFNPGHTASAFYWNDDSTGIYVPAPGTISETKRLRFNIDPYLKYRDGYGNVHQLRGRYFSADNNTDAGHGVQSTMRFAEYQFLRHFQKINLTLTAGGAYTRSGVQAELYGDTSYTATNAAAFLQLEQRIKKRLTLTAGFRYESNVQYSPEVIATTIFGTTTYDTIPGGKVSEAKPVFRFGLNFQLAKASYLRASYGEAYRYPTIAEKFIATEFGAGVPLIPNARLHSETGNTFEVGLKQGFILGGLKGFLDASYFISRYRDMIEFSFGGLDGATLAIAALNVGNTKISGFELTAAGKGKTGQVTHGFLFGWMYLNPRYTDFEGRIKTSSSSEDNILKYRFRNSWKADYELRFRKISGGFSLWHSGPVEAVDLILLDFIKGARRFREKYNGFTRVDLRAAYRITPKLKLGLAGENVLNAPYSFRPGQLEAPFNLSVRMDYDFF